MKEAEVLARARLWLSGQDFTLFRNNCGQYTDQRGHVVRYGLGTGSSDLIGWKSVVIGPEHMGLTIARFAAIEAKGEGGRLSPAQINFLKQVEKSGGHAQLVRPEDVEE